MEKFSEKYFMKIVVVGLGMLGCRMQFVHITMKIADIAEACRSLNARKAPIVDALASNIWLKSIKPVASMT